MRNNKIMIKQYLLLYFLSHVIAIANAQADVLVDLAPLDEISISNTQQTLQFTYKIAEPVDSLKIIAFEAPARNHNAHFYKLPYNTEVLAAASKHP